VTHAGDELKLRAWDRGRRGASAGGMAHAVAGSMYDDGRDAHVSQISGAVGRCAGGAVLAAPAAAGVGVSGVGQRGDAAKLVEVLREPVRPDAGEYTHATLHCFVLCARPPPDHVAQDER
jgi:hypothetical protein